MELQFILKYFLSCYSTYEITHIKELWDKSEDILFYRGTDIIIF